MIAAVELEDDETLPAPVEMWSHRARDSDWTAGYEELVRAASARHRLPLRALTKPETLLPRLPQTDGRADLDRSASKPPTPAPTQP